MEQETPILRFAQRRVRAPEVRHVATWLRARQIGKRRSIIGAWMGVAGRRHGLDGDGGQVAGIGPGGDYTLVAATARVPRSEPGANRRRASTRNELRSGVATGTGRPGRRTRRNHHFVPDVYTR
jgi:hypothetical protein